MSTTTVNVNVVNGLPVLNDRGQDTIKVTRGSGSMTFKFVLNSSDHKWDDAAPFVISPSDGHFGAPSVSGNQLNIEDDNDYGSSTLPVTYKYSLTVKLKQSPFTPGTLDPQIVNNAA